MNISKLTDTFQNIFARQQKPGVYFAPGRINLIGEHTDYNGGHVFPCAISLGTYGVALRREDNSIRLFSENFAESGIITCDLNQLAFKKEDNWANYPKGMIQYLKQKGCKIDSGMDIYFFGNLPNGAGLSSSASIELLTGVILDDLFQLDLERVQLVKTGQEVENQFIGVNSGIMDQFAVGMGKANQAILLDTNTLEYDWVPVEMGDHVIIIMNTNKRRELTDSKYNERRSECEKALMLLQRVLPIKSLGELDNAHFDRNTYLINNDKLIKRSRHAVYENQRTLQAKAALVENQLATFGKLVNASHISLHYDYEVTGRELDTLVETAWKQPGVLGARMTGAGFGGCAIAIVEKNQVASFQHNVSTAYQKIIGYAPSFYVAEISDGAKKIG